MQKEEEKFRSSDILEGMSSISALLHAMDGSCPANDRRILKILIDENRRDAKRREIGYLTAKSKEYGFPVAFVREEEIAALATGGTHGGILAVCTPRTLPALTADAIRPAGVYYCLEGVEDPYNFGYAVRSLYAAGADGIVLPPRNWMGAAGVVARSSAGTSELAALFVSTPEETIQLFRQRGYRILCAGIRNSVSLFEADLHTPLLVVIGGEKRGISNALLQSADEVVRIDYGAPFGGSLSTAAASAVFAFEILRQNPKTTKI